MFGRKKTVQPVTGGAYQVAAASAAAGDGVTSTSFEERFQEISDAAGLVESPEELRELAKSLTTITAERLDELSKAMVAAPDEDEEKDEAALAGDAAAGDALANGEPGVDAPAGTEAPAGADEDEDKDKEEAAQGKDLSKANPSGAEPSGADASGSLSDTIPQAVDAAPLIEALTDELAEGNRLHEATLNKLDETTGLLTKALTIIEEQGREITLVKAMVGDYQEAQEAHREELTKSLDTILSRPRATPKGAARVSDGELAPNQLDTSSSGGSSSGSSMLGGATANQETGRTRTDIIKALHQHFDLGHDSQSGLDREVLFRIDRLKDNELTKALDVAQKEMDGEYAAVKSDAADVASD